MKLGKSKTIFFNAFRNSISNSLKTKSLSKISSCRQLNDTIYVPVGFIVINTPHSDLVIRLVFRYRLFTEINGIIGIEIL